MEHIINGRHHLIMTAYDYNELWSYISNFVSSCSGDTWQEVASKLGRLGRWEFEDYRA
jgi:hypothetical protein